MGNFKDRQAKFFIFGVFDPNQVSKLGPQKRVTEPKKFSSNILKVSLFFLVYAVAQTR